ncbi:MAG: Hsp70 family protein [Myxococcales bacterium]|nr:Hsp70 family protein [Myxococcales bacterium]
MGAPVIGIDLGTTSTRVAVVEDGIPRVLQDEAGRSAMPAMLAVTAEGALQLGYDAAAQAVSNVEGVVYAAKRLIGRHWASPPVADALGTKPYRVVEGPHHDVRVDLRGSVLAHPEVSAHLIRAMKALAEGHLGQGVERCVLSVPAHFDPDQRQATRDAARIAGLEVARLISEPTAAALTYGLGVQAERTVAVLDLGGGTFDASVVRVGPAGAEVIATAGDTYLGGEDLTDRVVQWLGSAFKSEHDIDVRRRRVALARLREAAEAAKVTLSHADQCEIDLPAVVAGPQGSLDLQVTLTRAELEALSSDIVERCVALSSKALKAAGLVAEGLDDVVLLGAATRMPMVQRAVRAFFGRAPVASVHRDDSVALGAALLGASLAAGGVTRVVDITPRHLGLVDAWSVVEHDVEAYQTVITANSPLPTVATQVFPTTRDDQSTIIIMVYQGSSRRWDQSDLLGELLITDLPPAPVGQVEVQVTVELTEDGLVGYSVRDAKRGTDLPFAVTATPQLSDDELLAMTMK